MEELIEKAGILRRQQELLSKFKKRYIYLIGTEQDILTKLIYAFHENKDYQEFTYNKWSKRQYIFNNGGEVHYSTFLLYILFLFELHYLLLILKALSTIDLGHI